MMRGEPGSRRDPMLIHLTAALLIACGPAQDLDQVLEKADKLLEEAKTTYEGAKAKASVELFTEAGFKLEEARSKFQAALEVGTGGKGKTGAAPTKSLNRRAKRIHDGKVEIAGNAVKDPPKPPPPPA